MSANELLHVLRARPFQPFRLVMSNGTTYEVRHPELVIVVTSTAHIGYPSLNQPGAAAHVDIVSLRHVVRLEFPDAPQQAAPESEAAG